MVLQKGGGVMNGVKKVLNILLILFGVCLIVVCCDLVLNKAYQADLSKVDETDRAAVEELCSMISEFDSKYGSDYVWTENYNLRKCSFVLTRELGFARDRTYVVNLKLSKDITAQELKMPDEYSDIKVYRLSYFAPAAFKAERDEPEFGEFNGARVLYASFDKPVITMNGTGSLEESEVKMTFLDTVESVDTPTPSGSVHFEMDEENVALLGLQYRLIDDMLAEPPKEQLNELLAEYVLVRD